MVFIVWDRLFGTFADEQEAVRFGVTGSSPTHNLLRVIFGEWLALLRDLRNPVPFRAKLMYVFGPPGWKYAGHPAAKISTAPPVTSGRGG